MSKVIEYRLVHPVNFGHGDQAELPHGFTAETGAVDGTAVLVLKPPVPNARYYVPLSNVAYFKVE